MLYINTLDLDTFAWTNVFVQYKNTLLESIYGVEMLTGHPDQGEHRQYNTPTPLFIADASVIISDHKKKTRELKWALDELKTDRSVQRYLASKDIDRSRLATAADPKSALGKYLRLEVELDELGDVQQVVEQRLVAMNERGIGRVVFASSSRKDGKFFAYSNPDEWVDLLGSKAISHGNNLVSGNAAPPKQYKNLKMLIVDDDNIKLMARFGLGDCHGIINRKYVESVTRHNPYQYRGYTPQERWIFKGVLRPQTYTFGYDLILPLSSFKVDKTLINKPLDPGIHELPVVTLATHKIAKASWSSFGLNCQYFKSDAAVKALLSKVRDELTNLDSLYVNGKLDVKAISPILFGDINKKRPDETPDAEETQAEDNIFLKLYKLLSADNFGVLYDHPAVITLINRWVASKLKDIAIRGALTQRYLLACPCDELDKLSLKTVIINDRQVNDHAALLSRFPIRTRNDLQPLSVINLYEVTHQVHNTQLDYFKVLDDYLLSIGYNADDCILVRKIVRNLHLRDFTDCFWVSSSLWGTYGGDFDGDYGNLFLYSTMPELYEESLTWTRLPETVKPPKHPLTGTIEALAAKATSNEIGLLSWCSTIYNCFSDQFKDIDQILSDISEQMQLAVDSFKSTHVVDAVKLERWADQCNDLTFRKSNRSRMVHWIRSYKSSDVYTSENEPLYCDLGNDTIAKMVRLVNQQFNLLLPKPAPIAIFRELFPIYKTHNLKGKVYDFVGNYLTERAHLVRQYFEADGTPLKYRTNASGDVVPLGTDDFANYGKQKMALLENYQAVWKELTDDNKDKEILCSLLWSNCHSNSGESDITRSYLAFYVLFDEIIEQLQRPRTISMELVNQSDEFKKFILSGARLNYQARLVTGLDKVYPQAVTVLIQCANGEKDIGVVHSALPAKSDKQGNVLMRYDRLRINGIVPISIRFLRTQSNRHRYEVVAMLTPPTDTVVEGDDVAVPELDEELAPAY